MRSIFCFAQLVLRFAQNFPALNNCFDKSCHCFARNFSALQSSIALPEFFAMINVSLASHFAWVQHLRDLPVYLDLSLHHPAVEHQPRFALVS
jgi:hypothetical protein